MCRYCLDAGDVDDLVAACACRGSASHVHTSCLLEHARLQQQSSRTGSVSLDCPTCKTQYMGVAALRLLELQLQDVREKFGEAHVSVAQVLQHLATVHMSLYNVEEAKALVDQAVAMLVHLEGCPDVPFDVAGEPLDMAEALSLVSLVQRLAVGGSEVSLEGHQALAILEEHYAHQCGPDALRVSQVLLRHGTYEENRCQVRRILDRSFSLLEEYYGREGAQDQPSSQNTQLILAGIAIETGDFERARRICGRIVPRIRQQFGLGHLMMSMAVSVQSSLLTEFGEAQKALEQVDEVLRAARALAKGNETAQKMSINVVRVTRAGLLGELGHINAMREECVGVVETVRAMAGESDQLVLPLALRHLRLAEAALGNVDEVSRLFSGACNPAMTGWEDLLSDASVHLAIGEHEAAEACAQAALSKICKSWAAEDKRRVVRVAVSRMRRFWLLNLSGTRKATMEVWFDKIEADNCEVEQQVECSKLSSYEQNQFAAGVAVRSLVNVAALQTWAVREGDVGVIDTDPLFGYVEVNFGKEERRVTTLSLTDVCHPEDFSLRMERRMYLCRGLGVGLRVRSLVREDDWYPRALNVGESGVVTAVDRVHGRVNVHFGGTENLQGTLKFRSVCLPEEFDTRMRELAA